MRKQFFYITKTIEAPFSGVMLTHLSPQVVQNWGFLLLPTGTAMPTKGEIDYE